MGWTYASNWRKKADVLAEQLNPARFGFGVHKLIASQRVSEGYLAVWETPEGKRWLETSLIKKSGRRYMLKTMEESMGPVEFNGAAEVLFTLVGDPPNAYAARFRERVRASRKPKGRALVVVYPNNPK